MKKIIILLIINIFLINEFKDSSYSRQINQIYSEKNLESREKNNNKDIINSVNLNFSISWKDFIHSSNIIIEQIYFKLYNFSYIFNIRFNIIRVEYNILFYYKNFSLIAPSDLSLKYDLHLICHIYDIKSNISIDSLSFIDSNKYFKCIEYVNLNEEINFGIIIYKTKNIAFNETLSINYTEYFFSNSIFNYNKNNYKSNKFFYPLFIQKEFYLNNKNISFGLKKLYIKSPKSKSFQKIALTNNKWKFLNIFNEYFCLCRGFDCLYHSLLNENNSTEFCKYKFYLNIIEKNKHLYNKTYYLLADFTGEFESLDDSYPVFKKLIDLNQNAYYMTINKNIFINKPKSKYFNNIIKSNFINGTFLEKYLSLILRLKSVISAAELLSFNNIFFNIEYITYISLTHGLNYFKAYLFKTYYGSTNYNKIVVSSSEKIIFLAIKSGWNENNLIKFCLPKWDRLDNYKKRNVIGQNKSIFFFFTWRDWKTNISEKIKLQSDYFKNIEKLMNNEFLVDSIKKKKLEVKFCLHHMLDIYKDKINFGNNNIKFIGQNEIFNNILNANLLVTDFSSIIFEFIYQKKPFVLFIPDSKDPNIKTFYDENYYKLIEDLKDDSIDFINKFFDINKTVNKILYYINNDFKIEKKFSDFYKSFNFTCGNNTMKFINYLENLGK